MDENLKNEEVVEVDTSTDVKVSDVVESENNNQEEKIYTQADIDALQNQIDELIQYKPKELSEAEIEIQQKNEKLWNERVSFEIEKNGLEVFAEFIRADVDDTEALQSQITKLKEIVGTLELSNSYQPANHKPVDAYSLAKKSKDTKSMISAKLNR